jgi:hypothetical protein
MGFYMKKIRRNGGHSRVPALAENSKAKNALVVREEFTPTWEAGTLPTELHPQNQSYFNPPLRRL